jgi:hypothetical protein
MVLQLKDRQRIPGFQAKVFKIKSTRQYA